VNISLIIRELLFRHEKLAIPGFGTFTVEHKPAEISKINHTLTPPSKVIRFEEQQKPSDNLLLMALKKKLGISEPAAGEMVMDFVREIGEQLKKNESFPFEGLGIIKRNKSGLLEFEASPDVLNFTGAYALPELDIPLHETISKAIQSSPQSKEPLPKKIETQPEFLPAATRSRRSKYRIPAVISVMAVIVMAVLYVTGIFDPTGGRTTENNAVKTEKKKSEKIVFGRREGGNEALIDSVNREIEKNTSPENALNYKEEEPESDATVPSPIPDQQTIPSQSGNYIIVSGSFLEEANAEKHKMRLQSKGLSAEILPPGRKYYMVSLGSYETREEAATAMKQIREEKGLELWVMKRKVTSDE
jgi:nucleoid DNA-binding protein